MNKGKFAINAQGPIESHTYTVYDVTGSFKLRSGSDGTVNGFRAPIVSSEISGYGAVDTMKIGGYIMAEFRELGGVCRLVLDTKIQHTDTLTVTNKGTDFVLTFLDNDPETGGNNRYEITDATLTTALKNPDWDDFSVFILGNGAGEQPVGGLEVESLDFGSMTKAELITYADENGIDIDGLTLKADILQAILDAQ